VRQAERFLQVAPRLGKLAPPYQELAEIVQCHRQPGSLAKLAPDLDRFLKQSRGGIEVAFNLRRVPEVVHKLSHSMLILGRPCKRQPSLIDDSCRARAPFQILEKSEMAEHPGQTNAVAQLAQDCSALLEQCTRFGVAALNELLALLANRPELPQTLRRAPRSSSGVKRRSISLAGIR